MCNLKKKGWVPIKDTQPSAVPIPTALALPYPEHLSPARGTYTLGRWSPVLHGDALGIFHFPLGPALHTVCLHFYLLLLGMNNRTFPLRCQ